jgi:hypothetical protein
MKQVKMGGHTIIGTPWDMTIIVVDQDHTQFRTTRFFRYAFLQIFFDLLCPRRFPTAREPNYRNQCHYNVKVVMYSYCNAKIMIQPGINRNKERYNVNHPPLSFIPLPRHYYNVTEG